MTHQVKLTLVERALSTNIFLMNDNWLKEGDTVYNTRAGSMHEVTTAGSRVVILTNYENIKEGDKLQHI